MRWSFHIARIAGIDVKIHGTFILFLAFIAFMHYAVGGLPEAVKGVIFVSLVFLCVLLHEFGHALAARRYGIKTPDITLLPIGGVARLERMPEKPAQEVVVALAGPAVNVVIAAVLFLFVGVTVVSPNLDALQHAGIALPTKLFIVNIWLVIFNMVPAFPMDGGRVLRALLAMKMNYARATHIAASIGQAAAFGFAFYGLIQNQPMLILIGIFVYFGAANEAAFAQMKQVSSGMRVSAAMVTQFQTLPLNSTLNEAVEALLRTSQHEFPVVDDMGKVRGLLTRDDLIVGLRRSGAQTPVAEVMRVDIPAIHHSMLFDRAYELMQECGCPALPVLDSAARLIGLFTPENVGELMLVQSALAKAPRQAPPIHGVPPPIVEVRSKN
jgi:Zn-dependent protease/CBS domain-containing protein